MLDDMAPKKKKPDKTPPTEPVSVRLETELVAALDDLCQSQAFPPTRSVVIARALQELLERQGFWPRKPK